MTDDMPQTLLDAVRFFSDVDRCNDLMTSIKWPSGKIVCPHCAGERCAPKADRKKLRCKDCRKDFSFKVGTIFEDSPLGLDKWFVAVWSIANCKNGISSHELGRALGVTQKTAWFMLHRIRAAMKTGTFTRLKGEVESDETFIGGEAKNMHAAKREKKIKGRGAVGKAIVHGILKRTTADRGSEVRATVVGNTEGNTLVPIVRRNVEAGATVYTDAHAGYNELAYTHIHHAVDHIEKYVDGLVHTNGMENFWSLLKRGLKGTYVAVAPYHLFRYVDEQAFRFNKRFGNDAARFLQAMLGIVGRRLTWRVLTAQDDAGFMGIH
jgi:transposase-like protein